MFDVHFHWLPQEVLGRAREANPRNIMLRPSYDDIDASLRVMDSNGIETALVSFAFFEPLVRPFPGSRIEAFRSLNEATAGLRARYQGRFLACAAVDALAGEAAVPELDRAVREQGCSALEMLTCYEVDGETIFPHERRFWPLYRKAEELGIPVFVHPVRPPFWPKLPATVQFTVGDWGFLLGDQLALHLIACAGVFEEFPTLQYIFCQLGGFTPFTLGRIDLGVEMEKSLPVRTPVTPDLKLVRLRDYNGRYYVDIHSADATAIKCAAENLGWDRLLYATDYPITPASAGAGWHRDQLERAQLGDAALRAITGGNARRLFAMT